MLWNSLCYIAKICCGITYVISLAYIVEPSILRWGAHKDKKPMGHDQNKSMKILDLALYLKEIWPGMPT